jgi:hypothetical protein
MSLFQAIKNKRLVTAGAALAVAAATAMVTLPSVNASADGGGVAAARAATNKYHDLRVARADGYKLFKDANGVQCISQPGVGTMGIHFVNGTEVGDANETVTHPEAVIYEPEANGNVHLVGLEYVVLKSAWSQAGHKSPPSLFGHQFMLITAPNRYGLPDFYALHAWIWKNNPKGMFSPWNPTVSCHGHS